MKIGVIDVDTTHPMEWIPLERAMGHTVVGLWDGASVHPKEYVKEFAQKFSIPRVYDRMEQMIDDVDCVVIHGCDWDTHVAKARPFIEAGKAVLIDKPLAGNYNDLKQLCDWAKSGSRISGGSSMRVCRPTRTYFSRKIEERGEPVTVLCGCSVDDFGYGIHAYSMLFGILGGNAESITFLGKNSQKRIQINYPDGRTGIVLCGKTESWTPFHATVITEKEVWQYQISGTAEAIRDLYRSFLEIELPYLSGDSDCSVAMNSLIEAELWAICAKMSEENGGKKVLLKDVANSNISYDGHAYATKYREAKYPKR
ncbi:MAG: hypothetical protein A2Y12_17875 [Planctomycetes bacterium GWF2_42_9]|nr:MAG: hypothetical protein A2Y12_17875 [Planctomycetes bacterium GWF2_42_9]